MKVIVVAYDKSKGMYFSALGGDVSKADRNMVERVVRFMGKVGKDETDDKEGFSVRYAPVENGYLFCVIFRRHDATSRQYREYVGFLLNADEADELFQYQYQFIEEILCDNASKLLGQTMEPDEAFSWIRKELDLSPSPYSTSQSPMQWPAQYALYLGAYYENRMGTNHQTSIVAPPPRQKLLLNWLLQELPLPLRKTVSFVRNALDFEEASEVALVFSGKDLSGGKPMYRTKYRDDNGFLSLPDDEGANQKVVDVFLDGDDAQSVRQQASDYFARRLWENYSAKELWEHYTDICNRLRKREPRPPVQKEVSSVSYGLSAAAIEAAAKRLEDIRNNTEIVKMDCPYFRVQHFTEDESDPYGTELILSWDDRDGDLLPLDLKFETDVRTVGIRYDSKCYFLVYKKGDEEKRLNLKRNEPLILDHIHTADGTPLPRYAITLFGGKSV